MALAIRMWSPKSCVTSLMYGVSPHPAQAPENSKSGRQSCEPLTVSSILMSLCSICGRSMKNLKFSASGLRSGSCGSSLRAGALPAATSAGLLIGQTVTQRPQPVQS